MGKYMKKGKITGDVAVLEIPQPPSLGVRTRARTLALQPNPELSYLQLRSRRLEKFPPSNKGGGDSERVSYRVRVDSGSTDGSVSRRKGTGNINKISNITANDEGEHEGRFGHSTGEDACFGENNLDFDPSQRLVRMCATLPLTSTDCDSNNKGIVPEPYDIGWSTRESTPCSLIRDAEAISSPGSTARPRCSAAANLRDRIMQRAIPTTPEMEEFFAGFEYHQQESFLQKYNYDIVNDVPLLGRYEWVRINN